MNKTQLNQLEALCNRHAVSGDTGSFIQYLQDVLKKQKVPVQQNGFGVLCAGNTTNPKLLISAHVDEVGFQVVREHEEGGFLVSPVGHVSPDLLNNSHVYVQTKQGAVQGMVYPILPLGKNNPESLTQVVLQTVDNDRVSSGDFGSYQRIFHASETSLLATGLDNKISVLLLLELIKEQPELLKDTLFAFVTEEELKYDCIIGLTQQYKPEFALVIDMVPVHQRDAHKVERLPVPGKGPALLHKTNTHQLHEQARKLLAEFSNEYQPTYVELDFQPESQVIQRNGVTKGINIMIPMLGWHNAAYLMQLADYEPTKKLVGKVARKILQVK